MSNQKIEQSNFLDSFTSANSWSKEKDIVKRKWKGLDQEQGVEETKVDQTGSF